MIVGLTGGIGSGKSTIAQYLEAQGVPVYIADIRAKELMNSPEVVQLITKKFGSDLLSENGIDRAKLARLVFADPKQLKALNQIIHPLVEEDFRHWVQQHIDAPIVVKEAAILFETGSYKALDKTITVSAPEDIRINRVMQRDNVTREEVVARMKNQFSDEKRAELADFIVENINISEAKRQIDDILKKLRKI